MLRLLLLTATAALASSETTVSHAGRAQAGSAMAGSSTVEGGDGTGGESGVESAQQGAEYVVHPDIHPLERIKEWGEQIEKNNGGKLSPTSVSSTRAAASFPPNKSSHPRLWFRRRWPAAKR